MKNIKNRKKLAVAFVSLAILAVTFVGIAYATQYTGSTQNTGNTTTSTLIKVGQGAYENSFDKEVLYNTVTTSSNTTYSLNTSQSAYRAANAISGLTVPTVEIGSVTLTIEENAKADGTRDSYSLAITHDVDITGSYKIGYKIGDAAVVFQDFASAAAGGYTIEGITGAASTTVVITLYLTVSTEGTTIAPNATPMNNATFTFLATAGTA